MAIDLVLWLPLLVDISVCKHTKQLCPDIIPIIFFKKNRFNTFLTQYTKKRIGRKQAPDQNLNIGNTLQIFEVVNGMVRWWQNEYRSGIGDPLGK